MAKASLGKLDTRQPVTADLTKVRDITARMNTPAAPPQMSADFITPINVPQPKAWRPNALAVLDGVLGGGMTFTESRRAEEDRHRAELAMPQMEALKTRLLTELGKAGPDELKAYLTNPGEFGKNIATRLAASDLAAGSSRVYGNPDQGGSVYTAPKTDTAAGQAFSYGPDGVKALGAVPFVPDYVNVSEGGKAVPKMPILPPGFGGSADPTAGLPKIGEARPASVAPSSSGQPRSVRNNNPGNLEDGPFTRSQPGYKGTDGRFAIFETPDAGHAAQVALLGSYGKRGIDSVEGIINRWAPPTENDTGAYVNFVAQKVGVRPGDKINMADPAVLGKVAEAIRIFEGGPASKSNGPAVAVAAPASGDPAGTLYGAAKAKPPLARPATDAEKAVYGIPSSVPAQMKADGTVDVIALPKGTADIERDAQAKQAQVLKAKDIISTVDHAMSMIGKGEAGFVGAKMAEVPGTKAYDVARQIETIKANLGFQELAAMRAASPTGGALGAIAVQELVALQSTVANLDIGQSESQLRGNLAKIKGHYERWLSATQEGQAQGPTPGPGREKGWSKALPAPQVDAAKRFKGTKAPAGDPTNPFVPRNAAEFKNIPPGKSYIDDDGSVQVKR